MLLIMLILTFSNYGEYMLFLNNANFDIFKLLIAYVPSMLILAFSTYLEYKMKGYIFITLPYQYSSCV